MFENFKPKNQKLGQGEKLLLASHGMKYCARCKSVLPEADFWKGQFSCKTCSYERKADWNKKNPNFQKEYRAKNIIKARAYEAKWQQQYRENNRDAYNARDRKWRKAWAKEYRKNPLHKFRHRLRQSFHRIKNGKGGQKTMEILGVQSVEEFLVIMSAKTTNPNWLSDGWNIDHIWQIQWFKDRSLKSPEEVLRLLGHHSNLRPLSQEENFRRPTEDFSPLDPKDLPRFAPYLNADILAKIQKHFGG